MTRSWETLLGRGKSEEAEGRLRAAERFYRAALRAGSGSAPLEREFARFLESRGRFHESAARLRRALARGWPREEGEAALARLRERETSLSLDALIRRRKFKAAAKLLAADAGGAPGESGGRWPEVFSALLCAREYRAAFRLGEAMLEKSVHIPFANSFLWPWWFGISPRESAAKKAFCDAELRRVRTAAAGGDFAGWFAYCRGVLLLGLNRRREAFAEYERVKRLPLPRYCFMHHRFVMERLLAGNYKWTIAACRALLKKAPGYWWFQCRLAEALMAGGDAPEGLREFERAEAAADATASTAVMTWRGAALLWAGEYRRALAVLDEAEAGGAKVWVRCWRGGARLKLGDLSGALADLDRAAAADPRDVEAFLWRGEACRLLGRNTQALRDLDRALALEAGYCWGHANRALVRFALGDEDGMAADFARIPRDVVAAVRSGAEEKALTADERRAILEELLERAQGIRRPESYMNRIWMARRT